MTDLYDVAAIGNAIVDVIAPADDQFLADLDLVIEMDLKAALPITALCAARKTTMSSWGISELGAETWPACSRNLR